MFSAGVLGFPVEHNDTAWTYFSIVLYVLVVFDFGHDDMHSEVSPILSRCHEVHYCGVCHSIRCSTPAVSGSLFRLLHGGVLQRQRETRPDHL